MCVGLFQIASPHILRIYQLAWYATGIKTAYANLGCGARVLRYTERCVRAASRLIVQFHVLQLAVHLNTAVSNPKTVELLNEIP